MLQRELREVERRCQGAEARHEELASNIPEATRPLLRQLEAMQVTNTALICCCQVGCGPDTNTGTAVLHFKSDSQRQVRGEPSALQFAEGCLMRGCCNQLVPHMQAAAAANSEAWAAAERSLLERLSQAEGRAASAGERERIAGERLQAANSRASGMAAALEAARGEIANLRAGGCRAFAALKCRQALSAAHRRLVEQQCSMCRAAMQSIIGRLQCLRHHAQAANVCLRSGRMQPSRQADVLAAELTDVHQQQLEWANRLQRAEAGQATAQQALAAAQQDHAQAEAMMSEQVSATAVTGWATM